MTRAILANPHAFRVIAKRSKRRNPCGTNEATTTLMTLVLFLEQLHQSFHELVEAAESLNLFHFLGRQHFFGHLAQPFVGNRGPGLRISHGLDARKRLAKDAIKAIEVTLVFDQTRARQKVEVVDAKRHHPLLQRLKQRQIFGE